MNLEEEIRDGYTVSADMKKLWSVQMEILDQIDRICKKHNITYYADGGTLLGAVRHKGFIPWDDDLDVQMYRDDLEKFCKVAKDELKPPFFLQTWETEEGFYPWLFKVRKSDTACFTEWEIENNPGGNRGIFVDIFPIDNTTHNHWMQRWQYACAKYRVCYGHLQRKYKTASWQKKVLIAMAWPMKIGCVRRFVIRQSERYNDRETELVGAFYGTSRLSHCVYRRTTFGTPCRLPFENTTLPVASDYDDYLTVTFGDYMTPPPVEQQVCQHNTSIDFGPY